MAMVAQLVFVLFSLVSFTESSDVFKLVGSSVQLGTQHPVPKFDDLTWVLNTTNVVKYFPQFKTTKHYTGYEGRVEFNEETYSLTLKNLQKTDSGLYEAKVSGEKNKVVAEYRLSVLDPVKAPVLTHQLSRDTCNITLTCRGHDLSVNTSCYNETCQENEVTSPGGITLSLSVSGSTIICNHSNPVSWKTAVLEMRELKQHSADEGRNTVPSWQWPLVAVIVLTISAVIFFFLLYRRRRSAGHIECENTVYAEVESNGVARASTQLETPSTVYSAVGKKPQPTTNGQSSQTPVTENEQQLTSLDPEVPNTYEPVPDQMQVKKPETIYAAVSKSNKPVNEAKVNEAAPDVRN
ncbi:natural killer cell receptor 2B4-like isoform X1 [Pygocentrus nattereri]|uniref:natural killer cell receptor 2B4-like isoform X1 n=1 Tax=Pygocentrus nattereri TaxID=42514 RepID=UPI000814326A|nr:natural killer cell receptor 2B4-like isoform X1 [Pygocentrus nattereri]